MAIGQKQDNIFGKLVLDAYSLDRALFLGLLGTLLRVIGYLVYLYDANVSLHLEDLGTCLRAQLATGAEIFVDLRLHEDSPPDPLREESLLKRYT